MLVPLKVKDIGASKYKSRELALTIIYILNLNQEGLEVYICIKCKLYLVKGLKANMLISNNVFYTEGFFINLTNTSADILSCGVDIVISTRYYFKFLKYKVLANTVIFIPPKLKALVFFS